MHCIFKHCHQVSCILGLCDWLYILSVVVWIGFLPIMHFCFAHYMLMHPHALFFFLILFLRTYFAMFLLLLARLVSLTWHLGNLFLRRTRYFVVVLHFLLLFLLFLLKIGFVIKNPKRILMRTSVIGRFTWNSMSFCLIFQTHLFPVCLTLGVGNLFVRNLLDVPVCL